MHRTLPLLVLFACGLPGGKLLRDLDAGQVSALCQETPEDTYVCDQQSTTVGGADCLAAVGVDPSCTATVADWRGCDEALRAALDADPCAADYPSECDWIGGCAPQTP